MTQNSINTASRLVQFVSTSTAATSDVTVQMPVDNTIPQNTEGTEVLTLSITPVSSSSTLIITINASCTVDGTTASAGAWGLFQDTTANALSAVHIRANEYSNLLSYAMTSGTTSSTTFKLRIGTNSTTGSGGHIYINTNSSGARLMGGTSYLTMSIEEYI